MKGIRTLAGLLFAAALTTAASQAPPPAPTGPPSDQDVVDAYHYMLGRWLVLRQESLDLKAGFRWNEVVHRAPGGAASPNPQLDVATSEAWMYLDESSCTMIELPQITERYYTVQFVNGWGEVVDNVNERRNPKHPFGKFAMCVRSAKQTFPPEVRRLDLPNRKSHVVMRIELGADRAEAVALQKRITMKAVGTPKIQKAAADFSFTNDKLPGVAAFDRTEAILASEPDLNEGIEAAQAKARAVAKAAADPKQRTRIEAVIREQAIPAFLAAIAKMGPEINGWTRPRLVGNYRDDFLMRSIVNFTDIWANNSRDLSSFTARALDGSQTYIQIFANTALPKQKAKYLWSVTALDSAKRQVIPNRLNRFSIGKQSPLKLNPDGSLTLAFAPTKPAEVADSNWLPTPAGKPYDLTYRFYGAARDVGGGQYHPPPLARKDGGTPE